MSRKKTIIEKVLIVLIVGVFIFALLKIPQQIQLSRLATPVSAPELNDFTIALYKLHQQYNSKITRNESLEFGACERAQYMSNTNDFSHNGWDIAIRQFIPGTGYIGENLAQDFIKPDTIFNAWLNSPEHKANIIDQRFTDIGICKVGRYTVVWFYGSYQQ